MKWVRGVSWVSGRVESEIGKRSVMGEWEGGKGMGERSVMGEWEGGK